MSDTTPTTREESRESIRSALLDWSRDVVKPMIPSYRDDDGDGEPDFYTLNTFGQVVTIDASDPSFGERTDVSESRGGGIETGGDA